jgi:hypothetical protein
MLAVVGLFAVMQTAVEAQSLSDNFANLFTFGDCGQPLCLSVDLSGEHGFHYIPSVTQGENDLLGFLAGSIARSIASLPFTAASSGVTYRVVDGDIVASSVSSGAIFGERSQTLGRGRLLAGISVNSMKMDNIRGVPLRDLTFRFAHQNVDAAAMGDPAFENDIIEVRTNIDFHMLVTSAYLSYGVFDKLDIGVLVPFVRASLEGTSEAQVLPFSRPTPHLFGTVATPSEFADAAATGNAFGIGDVGVRIKTNLYQRDAIGFGVAAEARLPTGDSANFLGSGQTSVRALGILSGRSGNFSPHLNAGVAIRPGSNQNSSIIGMAGFDHLLSERVTFAVDLIGDYELGDSRLPLPQSVVFDEPARRRVRLTDVPDQNDNLLDAAVGLKMQMPGELRAVMNLLVPLAEGGLRPAYLWTFGLERSF